MHLKLIVQQSNIIFFIYQNKNFKINSICYLAPKQATGIKSQISILNLSRQLSSPKNTYSSCLTPKSPISIHHSQITINYTISHALPCFFLLTLALSLLINRKTRLIQCKIRFTHCKIRFTHCKTQLWQCKTQLWQCKIRFTYCKTMAL